MWTPCGLTFVLMASAAAQSENWEGYAQQAHQYAGQFYPGPLDGNFGEFLKHGQAYSHYPAQYASQHSKDRIAEAKGDESKQEHHFVAADPASVATPVSMAAEAPQAPQAPLTSKNLTESAEALTKRDEAAKDAEQSILALRDWGTQLKADLENKTFSRHVAQGIVSKVEVDYIVHRERLQHHFEEALHALEPEANETGKLEHEAKKCARQLEELDHEERKAMRSTLHKIDSAGKEKTKALWKSARKAAHQAYHHGIRAARAQRKEGEHERVYERTIAESERVSEGLLGRAESHAERAEDLMERQSESVEKELGTLLSHLKEEAHNDRKQRVHDAVERAHKARRAAKAAAQARKAEDRHAEHHSEASASKNSGKTDEKEHSAPQKHEGNIKTPANFLAQNTLESSSLAPVVLCAVGVSFASAFLVVRFRRNELSLAPPLLG